ncbi:MAG: hypothetical protein ACK5Q5_11425 [Planctomycetaceae bacterium]
MRRWASNLFIASYLGILSFGLFAHAFKYLANSHPAMYFVVWDMFCGWSAFEIRTHILGEGDSGQYYELAPGPWGGYAPFCGTDRKDLDNFGNYSFRLAANTLAQTEHEPIRRIIVVEEGWPKKYNLPPALWEYQYGTTKPVEPYSYFHIQRSYNGSGDLLSQAGSFLNARSEAVVLDNPALISRMQRGQSFFAVQPRAQQGNSIEPVSYETEAP